MQVKTNKTPADIPGTIRPAKIIIDWQQKEEIEQK
jgi:hypothetical protein